MDHLLSKEKREDVLFSIEYLIVLREKYVENWIIQR